MTRIYVIYLLEVVDVAETAKHCFLFNNNKQCGSMELNVFREVDTFIRCDL